MDGVEAEFKGRLVVIRVNIQDRVGKTLAEEYRFQYTPTFIYFDGQGDEQWRSVGSLDEDKLRESLP